MPFTQCVKCFYFYYVGGGLLLLCEKHWLLCSYMKKLDHLGLYCFHFDLPLVNIVFRSRPTYGSVMLNHWSTHLDISHG